MIARRLASAALRSTTSVAPDLLPSALLPALFTAAVAAAAARCPCPPSCSGRPPSDAGRDARRLFPPSFLVAARGCAKRAACGTVARFFDPSSGELLQAPSETATHFDIFGLPHSFDLDLGQLEAEYKAMQRLLHPDKFTLRPAAARELSAALAARVNVAYATLKDPLKRGLYIIRLNRVTRGRDGAPGGAKDGSAASEESDLPAIDDPALLMEVRRGGVCVRLRSAVIGWMFSCRDNAFVFPLFS